MAQAPFAVQTRLTAIAMAYVNEEMIADRVLRPALVTVSAPK